MTTPTATLSENINLVRVVPKFTAPEPTPDQKDVAPTVEATTTEPPIENYENKTGHPLLVDHLDVKDIYQKMGLKNEVANINAYILSQIEERSLRSTKESYLSILSSLEAELNLDPNLDYDNKLKKLSSYIIIAREQNRLNKLKKEFNG